VHGPARAQPGPEPVPEPGAAHGGRPGRRRRAWLAAASAGLVASACLAACTDGGAPAPSGASEPAPLERNAPGRAEYFLDSEDQYFQNLAAARADAPDAEAEQRIETLLQTPVAQWLTGPPTDAPRTIAENLRRAEAQGAVPVFVVYNITDRDLGGESGGGSESPDAYRSWVGEVSDAVGDAPAVLVLEPDALAGVPQMDGDQQDERIGLLHDALTVFRERNPAAAVYLDVGHSRWLTAARVADLVDRVDEDGTLVTGVALNVSNQRPEAELREYAADLWDALGRRVHVILDSSMNGASNTGELLEWCNPEGERVGTLPDTVFDPDAWFEEVYVKAPGESDGRCGTSARPAGAFDAGLLLEQVADDPA
jgi:endoglucanase